MSIKENLSIVLDKIDKVAQKADRNPNDIKLLAVTKTHAAEVVDEAIAAGARFIGENKIQESEDKLAKLKEQYTEFHYIGHLQSNKIKKLMPLKPTLIHSIDKISTAKKLNNYLETNGVTQDILIQINTSGEISKFGINPLDTESFIKELSKFNNIRVKGMMTIGLNSDNEEKIRAGFRELKTLFDKYKTNPYSNIEMKYLSMGMTSDFEIAIEEGANIVRIGSAIFGNRIYK